MPATAIFVSVFILVFALGIAIGYAWGITIGTHRSMKKINNILNKYKNRNM